MPFGPPNSGFEKNFSIGWVAARGPSARAITRFDPSSQARSGGVLLLRFWIRSGSSGRFEGSAHTTDPLAGFQEAFKKQSGGLGGIQEALAGLQGASGLQQALGRRPCNLGLCKCSEISAPPIPPPARNFWRPGR